jgi:hypothetical protein
MPSKARPLLVGLLLLGLATITARDDSPRAVEQAAPVVPAVAVTTPSTSTSTSTSTTTTTLPPTYPLTGHPAPDPALRDRPALAVKIDNVALARPQSGLERADLIYEEFTEGVTRFIVIFQSDDAEVVGPVRSVRPADPVIVTPLGGVFGFSGGSPAAVDLARATPLTLVTEGNVDVMYRRPGRSAPHNLYTSTAGIRSKAPAGTPPPAKFGPFLPLGGAFTAAGGTPVTRLDLAPAPFLSAAYTYDAATGTWNRFTDGTPHLVEGGRQVAPTNVILQFTPYSVFVADAAVQYPEVIGTGEAWILSDGWLVTGSWAKPSPEAPTTFADAAGAPIALPPGQTWIHLLAPGSFVAPG